MTVQMQAETPRVLSLKTCFNPDCPMHNPQPLANFHFLNARLGRRKARCATCSRAAYRAKNLHKARKPAEGCGEITYAAPDGEEPYAIIPLHGKYGIGKVTKVSLEDVFWVKNYRWYLTPFNYVFRYEPTPGKRSFRQIRLHRQIFSFVHGDGRIVDHKENDTLDNRRSMLREASSVQNGGNRVIENVKNCQYKGVRKLSEGRYRVYIGFEMSVYNLGIWPDAKTAALVYDRAARFHFREFAKTNFLGTDAASVETITQELRSQKLDVKTSKYRGVFWNKRGSKYVAAIYYQGRSQSIGSFKSAAKAARAYDEVARYLQGAKAKTNFSGSKTTSFEEMRTRLKPSFSSQFVGVHLNCDNKWVSQIKAKGVLTHLGLFTDEKEAAKAYDEARVARNLPRVNFPETLAS